MKEFRSRRGIAYVERDISGDEQTLDEVSRLGDMTTPVTTVDGEVVVGFDQKRPEASATLKPSSSYGRGISTRTRRRASR